MDIFDSINKDSASILFELTLYIYIYIYTHHHDVTLLAHISLTLSLSLSLSLSLHFSLSSIASGRSSRLLLCPYKAVVDKFFLVVQHLHICVKGVHWRTSHMSSSLLQQQCPVGLVCLIWMVLEMRYRWLFSCSLWDVASRICSL